jgi:hypothetical protein
LFKNAETAKKEKPNQPAEGAAQEAGDKSKADLRRERKAIQVIFYYQFQS